MQRRWVRYMVRKPSPLELHFERPCGPRVDWNLQDCRLSNLLMLALTSAPMMISLPWGGCWGECQQYWESKHAYPLHLSWCMGSRWMLEWWQDAYSCHRPLPQTRDALRVENFKRFLFIFLFIGTRSCYSWNGFTLRIFILSDLFLHWTLIDPFVWTDVITQGSLRCLDSVLWRIPSFCISTFWPTL